MNTLTKNLFGISIAICLILSLVLTGCAQIPVPPTPPEQTLPPATTSPKNEPIPPSELPQNSGTQRPASSPSVPIKINLSISEKLEFNKPTDLTCTISSLVDAPNTEANVKLPVGATLISGTLTWQGALKAKEPFSFSAQIIFNKEGKWAIEGTVSDKSNGWGDKDTIYLTIVADHSEIGWPLPEPPPVHKVEAPSVPVNINL